MSELASGTGLEFTKKPKPAQAFQHPFINLPDVLEEFHNAATNEGDAVEFEQTHRPPFTAPIGAEDLRKLLLYEAQRMKGRKELQKTSEYKFLANIAFVTSNPRLDFFDTTYNTLYPSLGKGVDRAAVGVFGGIPAAPGIVASGDPSPQETIESIASKLNVEAEVSEGLVDEYAVLFAVNSLRKNPAIRESIDSYLREKKIYEALAWVEQPHVLGTIDLNPAIYGCIDQGFVKVKSIGEEWELVTKQALIDDENTMPVFAKICGSLYNIERFVAGTRPVLQISLRETHKHLDSAMRQLKRFRFDPASDTFSRNPAYERPGRRTYSGARPCTPGRYPPRRRRRLRSLLY